MESAFEDGFFVMPCVVVIVVDSSLVGTSYSHPCTHVIFISMCRVAGWEDGALQRCLSSIGALRHAEI